MCLVCPDDGELCTGDECWYPHVECPFKGGAK